MQLQRYSQALLNADEALRINPFLVKAAFRRALALEGLGQSRDALTAARHALHMEPHNQAIAQLASRLAPYSTIQKPPITKSMMPKLLASAPFQYLPSNDNTNENLLVMLHGFGDRPEPFARLATQLSLPQTAALALGAPYEVPMFEGGRSWCTFVLSGTNSVEKEGEVFRSINASVDSLQALLHTIQSQCSWEPRKVHLFGFSQGGSVALELARRYARSGKGCGFGSCIAVASPLLEPTPSPDSDVSTDNRIANDPTPILLLHGDKDTRVTPDKITRATTVLREEGLTVKQCTIPGKGHTMIGSADEARVLMDFWAAHLSRRPPEDENSELIEVTPGKINIEMQNKKV